MGRCCAMLKNKSRKIVYLIIAVLLIAACIWRFWPHSFTEILPLDQEKLTGLHSHCVIVGIADGGLQMDTYLLDLSRTDEGFAEVLKNLAASKYRQDFRNILGSDGFTHYGGTNTIYLQLRSDESSSESVYLVFLSDKLCSLISADGSGSVLYHPSDRSLYGRLAEYIQQNGARK